jgi:DNA-binding IclR family transcriptional regulator
MDLSEDETRKAFEPIRFAWPLSFETYLREVNRARRRGWAVDDGYFSAGVLAVAAPLCEPSGHLSFTVSAVMIRGQRSDAEVEVIGEALRDLGLRLEAVVF